MNRIHSKLFHNHAPFAAAAVTALLVGVGDIGAIVGDLIWLVGDTAHEIHPYHYAVYGCLLMSLVVILVSFIWLYRSIIDFLAKKERPITVKAFVNALNYKDYNEQNDLDFTSKSKKTSYTYIERQD